MTDAKLASELRAISRELDEVLAAGRAEVAELNRRFAEEHGAIEKLLHSVQEKKWAAAPRQRRCGDDRPRRRNPYLYELLRNAGQLTAAGPKAAHTRPRNRRMPPPQPGSR